MTVSQFIVKENQVLPIVDGLIRLLFTLTLSKIQLDVGFNLFCLFVIFEMLSIFFLVFPHLYFPFEKRTLSPTLPPFTLFSMMTSMPEVLSMHVRR